MRKGVFIGRTTMDILFYQRGVPLENQKVKTEEYTTCIGGNACNAAVTYSILGGNAMLLTAVGDSMIGKSIKAELTEHYGIEVIDLLEDRSKLPFLSAIWINLENETRTLWGGHQAPARLLFPDLGQITEEAEFFLTDDQLPQLILPLFQLARDKNIPRVFDAERWEEGIESLFRVSSDVIASSDCRPTDKRTLFEILKENGVSCMAVTDGSNPVIWRANDNKGRIIPMEVDAVDTLAAGDILHGAYCYFRFQKRLPFEKALEKACEVSSISVTYRGPRQGIAEYAADCRRQDRNRKICEEYDKGER